MQNVVIERAHDTHNGAQATKKNGEPTAWSCRACEMSEVPDQNVQNTDNKIISWSISGQTHKKGETTRELGLNT